MKHVIEGNTKRRLKVKGKRSKWCKQLLGYLKERIASWKLKEEALNCTLCIRTTGFGSDNGPVVRLWND
jgi:hypothetical protein